MNATGDYNIYLSKPGSERQRLHIFSHLWKIDPKDKCIHKYIMWSYNMFLILDCSVRLGRDGRREERVSNSKIYCICIGK
jgi:hypothetical protein